MCTVFGENIIINGQYFCTYNIRTYVLAENNERKKRYGIPWQVGGSKELLSHTNMSYYH